MRKIFSFGILAAVLILSGCGETSLRVAEQRADRLAAQHAAILAAYGGLYNHPRPASYVQAVLDRVLVAQPDDDKQFTAFVLDNNAIDTFAITDGRGGRIYITRGMLALLGDEAQLATLLAHEIAHIELRHTRYRRRISADIRHSLYSHSQDIKADSRAMALVAAAGYQPAAHRQMLATLERYDAIHDVAWFAAHRLTPKRQDRVAAKAAEIAAAQRNKRFIRAQKRFLNAIDGLVFMRVPPRDFFVKGRRLHHSGLDIQFEMPQGFVFDDFNAGEKITARHSNGLSLVFDSAVRDTALTPQDYLTNIWAKDLSPDTPQNLNVAGAAAARINVREIEQSVTLLVIQHGTNWLRFALFSPPHISGQTQSVMNAVRRSFAFALGADKPRDKTVRIVLVQRGDSVSALSQRMHYDGDKAALFRILNGLEKGGILRAASAVKLIE